MSSNSIRISASLFEIAQRQATLMCRSTAQQVEHWARLGAALEASGTPTDVVVRLLDRVPSQAEASFTEVSTEMALRAFKRERQARDMKAISSGAATNDQMSWFTKRRARAAKPVNSPL
jgi:hypothetical protein